MSEADDDQCPEQFDSGDCSCYHILMLVLKGISAVAVTLKHFTQPGCQH